jgi:hypothetical protein
MLGTKEAAKILGIGQRRLVTLLNQGRVHGAYKIGKFWVIPLINGEPAIAQSNHGPQAKWKRTKRLPALTQIQVNRTLIGKKDSQGHYVPVISVQNGGKNMYSKKVVIPGPCTVVYDYENANCSGARIWIETYIQPTYKGGVDGITLENSIKHAEIQTLIKTVS